MKPTRKQMAVIEEIRQSLYPGMDLPRWTDLPAHMKSAYLAIARWHLAEIQKAREIALEELILAYPNWRKSRKRKEGR